MPGLLNQGGEFCPIPSEGLIKSKMSVSQYVGVSSPTRVERPSAAQSRYVTRRPNMLQAILRAHFDRFAALYNHSPRLWLPAPWLGAGHRDRHGVRFCATHDWTNLSEP